MQQVTALTLHQKSRILEVAFQGGQLFRLPFEFLRVHSPSAEVQGHGPGQEVLQAGKRNVAITAMGAVGNYGVQPVFSDGHDSGIFSWDYLFELGVRQEALWQAYEHKLAQAGLSRDEAPTPQSASCADHSGGHGSSGGCGGHA
jgi:DUF971 family protein